jgi:hypothetical protein
MDWRSSIQRERSKRTPNRHLLAQLPSGEANPLSAKSRSSETKTIVKIGVGLLPYISIGSVWQKRRPVAADFSAYRRQLRIDTKSCRTEMLADLTANYNCIPRSCYLFGASWRSVWSAGSDSRNCPVLLRALDAPGPGVILGRIRRNIQRRAEWRTRRRRCKSPSPAVAGRSRCLDFGSLHVHAGNAKRNQQAL